MLCEDVVCNVTAPPSSSAAIWLLPGACVVARFTSPHAPRGREPPRRGRPRRRLVRGACSFSYEARGRASAGRLSSTLDELNSKTHKPTCVLATKNLLLKTPCLERELASRGQTTVQPEAEPRADPCCACTVTTRGYPVTVNYAMQSLPRCSDQRRVSPASRTRRWRRGRQAGVALHAALLGPCARYGARRGQRARQRG